MGPTRDGTEKKIRNKKQMMGASGSAYDGKTACMPMFTHASGPGRTKAD